MSPVVKKSGKRRLAGETSTRTVEPEEATPPVTNQRGEGSPWELGCGGWAFVFFVVTSAFVLTFPESCARFLERAF